MVDLLGNLEDSVLVLHVHFHHLIVWPVVIIVHFSTSVHLTLGAPSGVIVKSAVLVHLRIVGVQVSMLSEGVVMPSDSACDGGSEVLVTG